jgi:hypothetical protein
LSIRQPAPRRRSRVKVKKLEQMGFKELPVAFIIINTYRIP